MRLTLDHTFVLEQVAKITSPYTLSALSRLNRSSHLCLSEKVKNQKRICRDGNPAMWFTLYISPTVYGKHSLLTVVDQNYFTMPMCAFDLSTQNKVWNLISVIRLFVRQMGYTCREPVEMKESNCILLKGRACSEKPARVYNNLSQPISTKLDVSEIKKMIVHCFVDVLHSQEEVRWGFVHWTSFDYE